MIDLASIRAVQKHIRRTGRSLLQYVHESFPWTRDSADVEVVSQLDQMLRDEQKAVAALTRFLIKERVTPTHLGPYPMHFTNFNFLALDRLLELLVEHHGQDITDLQADLARLPDSPARPLLAELLAAKKRHLDSIKQLSEKYSSASTVK